MNGMSTATLLALYGGLFVTGIASSLHCVGMCGPILIGFCQVFERTAVTIRGQRQTSQPPSLAWDLLWYHTGRIWTYAALGFMVGIVGQALHHGSAWIGWQRAAGLILGVAVVVGGAALLGVVPGLKLETVLDGCKAKKWFPTAGFQSLVRGNGVTARLLLGVVMGLLPCGLVYAVLAIVAGLPTPWHSALGMVFFGLGTLPSLTAVLVASHLVPEKLRVRGTRFAAVMIIASGLWMIARDLMPHDHSGHHSPPSVPLIRF